jgi:copper resistance protein B
MYFGDTAMARARRDMNRMHGAMRAYRLLIDRAEARLQKGSDAYLVDAQAWYGGDINKLWIKAEAEGAFGGDLEEVEVQALWSHAIGPWFDLQTGVRFDVQEGDDRAHLVLGLQGLAPYWIEIETAAFLSDNGDLTARFEAEHDARITQNLTLQPRAELDFALQDIPEQSIGSGLTSASVGARLRYQVTQLFEPYIGVEYERAFGETRAMRKAAGESLGGANILAGIRAWF